jgi:hypothetical protein
METSDNLNAKEVDTIATAETAGKDAAAAVATDERIENESEQQPARHSKHHSHYPCSHLHPNRKCVKNALMSFGRSFYIAYGLRMYSSLPLVFGQSCVSVPFAFPVRQTDAPSAEWRY